ncbi:MAG: PQQ-binding-like beta-propeller repeat protein [Hyphomicrobium sp.]
MVMTDFGEVEVPRMRVMAAEQVVAVGQAGQVYLLELRSGKTLWTFALSAEKGATGCEGQPVTIGIVGELVLAGSMGHVFALRLDNGELLWHKDQRLRGTGETNFAFGAPRADYVSSLES